MKIENNTILITGGSNGIGLALAERFLRHGNKVIICGRRQDKLDAAKSRLPRLHTRRCDVGDEAQRLDLHRWTTDHFPALNVLINNAGIQQRIDLAAATSGGTTSVPSAPLPLWQRCKQELAINLDAPIHLAALFVPHLKTQPDATIINVTSGLAFMPSVWAPIYGATKAAMHSFTFSLRQQLAAGTANPVKVIEIIPPAVNTDLGGAGLHTFGEPLDAFADAIFRGLETDAQEIGYSYTTNTAGATRAEMERRAMDMWGKRKRD